MPILLSSTTPLNVQTDGDDRRPALVLINPLGTTLAVWDPMMPRLAEHNFVIRFDVRGHGHSTPVGEPYGIPDLGNDVLHILDVLEVPQASVLGASLGGLVGVWLAATHPERVDRLILVSTAPKLGPDYWWQRTIATVEREGLESVVDHVHQILCSEGLGESDPEAVKAARDMFLSTPVDAYLAGARAILQSNVGPLLESIRASTLLVVGEDDPVLQHHPAEDILAKIPDSEALLVGGARHRVFLEQPEAIAQVVSEFLTDPDGR